MSYRMIHAARRLMCDKFSILCTIADLNARQTKEDDGVNIDEFIASNDAIVAEVKREKLTEMYEMQTQLDTRIISERGIEKSVDEWVVGLTIAMESEIDEIRREVNYKWWKNPKEINYDALQGEVIDAWHFLLSLSRVVGMGPDDIHRLYMEKNAENHARQDGNSNKEGYSLSEE